MVSNGQLNVWKKTVDVVESEHTTLKKTNKHWHIPLTFFSNHLNGRT
jgi:hypothetical protein